MSESVLKISRRGRVQMLTLNRPEVKNALNGELVDALSRALEEAKAAGADIRAILLTGAGGAFCAGADLSMLKGLRTAGSRENLEDSLKLKRLYLALLSHPLPIIASVDGPALAGGCGLASACDVILASEWASFGYPEVRVGFVAAMVSVLLARQLGDRVARELLLTGRTLGAEEAMRMGMVNRIVPAERLEEEALAFARKLSQGAPSGLALTKELLLETSGMSIERAVDFAARVNVFARTGPEMREGLDAFFSKRRPSWIANDADSD
ncbi:MAG: enoyl-CoA hydratase-related protein [Acidobacteriota bacterium]